MKAKQYYCGKESTNSTSTGPDSPDDQSRKDDVVEKPLPYFIDSGQRFNGLFFVVPPNLGQFALVRRFDLFVSEVGHSKLLTFQLKDSRKFGVSRILRKYPVLVLFCTQNKKEKSCIVFKVRLRRMRMQVRAFFVTTYTQIGKERRRRSSG